MKEATRRQLEEQCRNNPDQPGPWMVYTDWLLEEGDVEGERALLRRQGEALDEQLFAGRVRQGAWRFGFLSGVGIRRVGDDRVAPDKLADLTQSLLSSPIARFVDSIWFGPPGNLTRYGEYDGTDDWTATMTAVAAASQGPWIRELVFDNADYGDAGGAFGFAFGDFSSAWSALPRLERLFIDSGGPSGRLGALDLPSLRTFCFSTQFETGLRNIASICDAQWPALQYLELDVDGPSGYDGPEGGHAVHRLLHGDGFPALVHLRLRIWPRSLFGGLIGDIARSPILPRLRSLTLETGPVDDRIADEMVHHAAAFRHLDVVALAGTDLRVPQELHTLLRGAMPNFDGDILDSRESFDRSAC